jgi:hypothetical protein
MLSWRSDSLLTSLDPRPNNFVFLCASLRHPKLWRVAKVAMAVRFGFSGRVRCVVNGFPCSG